MKETMKKTLWGAVKKGVFLLSLFSLLLLTACGSRAGNNLGDGDGNLGSGNGHLVRQPAAIDSISYKLLKKGEFPLEGSSYAVFSLTDTYYKEKMPVFVYEHSHSNTFIIKLHGGPGGDMNPGSLKDVLHYHYNIVYWQQRGSGYSTGPTYSTSTLTKDLILNDLKQLILELKQHYGEDIAIVLSGESWGVTLGFHFVLEHPDMVDAFIADSGSYDFNNSLIRGYLKITEKTTTVRDDSSQSDEHFDRIKEQFIDQSLDSYESYKESTPILVQNAHYSYLKQAEYILTYSNDQIYGYESYKRHKNPTYYGLVNWRKVFTEGRILTIDEESFFSPIELNKYIANPLQSKTASVGRGNAVINQILQSALREDLTEGLASIKTPSFFLYADYDLQFPVEFHSDICDLVQAEVCQVKEYQSAHVVMFRAEDTTDPGSKAQRDADSFLQSLAL